MGSENTEMGSGSFFMTIEGTPEYTSRNYFVTPASLRDVTFPSCSKRCAAVEMLGVSECESVCSHKFDVDGNYIPLCN